MIPGPLSSIWIIKLLESFEAITWTFFPNVIALSRIFWIPRLKPFSRPSIWKLLSSGALIFNSIFLKCFLFLAINRSRKSTIKIFFVSSFLLTLENSRNSSNIASIELTSSSISLTSWLSFSSVSDNFKRVSGVLRSWLTPDNIWVRCFICLSILARIARNATPARRTSLDPPGLKLINCPFPKASAALASLPIGLIWFLSIIKESNTSNMVARTISTKSWWGLEALILFLDIIKSNRPELTKVCILTVRGSDRSKEEIAPNFWLIFLTKVFPDRS